jgi:ankyrin repeat protein
LGFAIAVGFAPRLLRGFASQPGGGGSTFWQDGTCDLFRSPEGGGWTWCVPAVVVNEDGQMEVRVRWTGLGLFHSSVDKGSDAGNRNMYLTDDLGNRYDHVETWGAAAEETRLSDRYPSALGTFIFPPAKPGASVFTFHDADQNRTIENIKLEPLSRTDDASSLSVLAVVSRARQIDIVDSWGGLHSSYHRSYRLTRDGDVFSARVQEQLEGTGNAEGPLSVPAAAVDAFLKALSEAPLLTREYVPTMTHFDDYPFRSIAIETGSGHFEFVSESQGAGMAPWKLLAGEKTFVVPDDTASRALALLASHLPDLHVSIADERPEYGSGFLSTGDTRLIDVARRGDTERVRMLLREGADVELRNPEDGVSSLFAAASSGHAETVRVLLEAGAAVDASTMCHLAASGDTDVLRVLAAAGANLDLRIGSYAETALMLASENGHWETARLLLAAGADVNARASYGGTALRYAAGNRYPDVVQLLIASGADVDVVTEDGASALMETSVPEIARALLRANADVNVRDNARRSVLTRVIWGSSSERHTGSRWVEAEKADVPGVVNLLLAAGADVHAKDDSGRTPLMWTAQRYQGAPTEAIARSLLRAGAAVDARDDEGRTALHYAVAANPQRPYQKPDLEMVRMLVAAGADPNGPASDGSTPLALARSIGDEPTIALLEARSR